MLGKSGHRTRLVIGGLAATGVVVAHGLSYLVVSPDPHIRSELLESTGHGRFSMIVALALGLLAAGLVRFAAGPVWGAGTTLSGRRLYARTAPRLLILQLGGFLVLEGVERAFVGESPAHLFAEQAITIGLFIQAVVAFVGAALLVLLTKSFEKVFSRAHVASPGGEVWAPTATSRVVPPRFVVASGGGTLRGPPHDL